MRILWRVIDFLQTYNGAVTAVATVFIGVFTYVLARVTGRQARLTTQALGLGRQEFIASHRPRFEIREPYLAVIECPADQGKTAHQVRFILANSGESEGTLIESFALVMQIPHNSWKHLVVEGPRNDFGAIKLPAGAYKEISFALPAQQSETVSLLLEMHAENQPLTPRLFFRGALAYTDDNGTRRRTSFCRPLDPNTKCFTRTAGNEYDYCD